MLSLMVPKSILAERTSVSYIPIKSDLKGLSIDVFIFIVSKLWAVEICQKIQKLNILLTLFEREYLSYYKS